MEQHTTRITYAILIVASYLIIYLVTSNSIIAFVLSLNILYFTRELLYKKLFRQETQSLPESHMVVSEEQPPEQPFMTTSFSLLKSESDYLPNNIKEKLFFRQQQLEIAVPVVQQATATEEHPVAIADLSPPPTEGIFITAIQQAESLIVKKIQELQAKQVLRKEDIEEQEQEIKEEVAKSLPEVPAEQWETWTPLVLQDKVKRLAIYCEKCVKTIELQHTRYEITKTPDHYVITAVHNQAGEQHTLHANATLDTFEILAKPVVTIDQPKKVEA